MVVCGPIITLFGGFNKESLNDIYQIDIRTAKWGPIEVKSNRPLQRYGHSACYYNGKLIIYGGEYKYNPEVRMRDTLCDLWAFDFKKNDFKQINPGNKLICEPRKNHIMALVGFNLLI